MEYLLNSKAFAWRFGKALIGWNACRRPYPAESVRALWDAHADPRCFCQSVDVTPKLHKRYGKWKDFRRVPHQPAAGISSTS